MSAIGTAKCDCGGTITYSETKTGGLSGTCQGCGSQFFHRSPKAVDSLKRRLAANSAPPKESAGDDKANAEAFDLGKL
jgi:hypothetical protein